MENDGARKCLECGHEFYGRTDKKFCSNSCKNKYHNHSSHNGERLREKMFSDLCTNHHILENLLKMGLTSINLYDLEAVGFKPSLITGYVHMRRYDELRCFDICYRQTPERIYEIKEMDLGGTRRICQTPLPLSYDKNH